jgi:hypothetical protein
MMTARTTTDPLHDDGVIWIRSGNSTDLSNTIDRTRFEYNVLNARIAQSTNDLCDLLRTGNIGSNTQSFNGQSFALISCHSGNWKPNWRGLIYNEFNVPTPGGINDWRSATLVRTAAAL